MYSQAGLRCLKIILAQGNFISLWETSVRTVYIYVLRIFIFLSYQLNNFFFYFLSLLAHIIIAASWLLYPLKCILHTHITWLLRGCSWTPSDSVHTLKYIISYVQVVSIHEFLRFLGEKSSPVCLFFIFYQLAMDWLLWDIYLVESNQSWP